MPGPAGVKGSGPALTPARTCSRRISCSQSGPGRSLIDQAPWFILEVDASRQAWKLMSGQALAARLQGLHEVHGPTGAMAADLRAVAGVLMIKSVSRLEDRSSYSSQVCDPYSEG